MRRAVLMLTLACLVLCPAPAWAGRLQDLQPIAPCLAAYGVGRYEEAAACCRPLAKGGDPQAQVLFGTMYASGQGVRQNDEEAYAWFSLAAAQGDENAVKGRDLVASLLTSEALEKAQARAAELHAQIAAGRAAP